MSQVFEVVGSVFVVLGALVFASAALGLLRFPDTYTRISAVGTSGGVGMALVIVGALSLQPTVPDAFKAVAIIALQLAMSAVGSIAIARSAYLTGTPLYEPRFDELAEESDPDEREEARLAREERETPKDVE